MKILHWTISLLALPFILLAIGVLNLYAFVRYLGDKEKIEMFFDGA